MDGYVEYKPLEVISNYRVEIPTLPSSDILSSIATRQFILPSTPEPTPQTFTITAKSSSKDSANVSFEDLVKKYNLPIKITSGYRGSDGFRGGKTKSGKQSNHNKMDEHGHPMAYDIQPLVNGKVDKSDSAFANLRNILANNQEVREWFKQRNWGILDETTPQMMAKTGATGKHFHIGPDSAAIRFS